MNGNVEHSPTDMEVNNHAQPAFSLTTTQVQDMKVLLSTLSLLSRSVQVPNKLFEKVSSIAQRGGSYSEAYKSDASIGHENRVRSGPPLQPHHSKSPQPEVPQTVTFVQENGDTLKAQSTELNSELRVEGPSSAQGCTNTAHAHVSEGRLVQNYSTTQSEPSEKPLTFDEGLQLPKSLEKSEQSKSAGVYPQELERSKQISSEGAQPGSAEDVGSPYVPGHLLAELDAAMLDNQRFMTSAELRNKEKFRMDSKLTHPASWARTRSKTRSRSFGLNAMGPESVSRPVQTARHVSTDGSLDNEGYGAKTRRWFLDEEDKWESRSGTYLGVIMCNHECKTVQCMKTQSLAPRAEHDDGVVHLLLVRNVGRLQLMRFFLLMQFGRHLSLPFVEYSKARAVWLKPAPGAHHCCGVDGELLTLDGPITTRVQPHSCQLIGKRQRALALH